MLPLLLVMMLLSPSMAPTAVSGASVAPDSNRRLINNVELWSRVTYNDPALPLASPMGVSHIKLDKSVRSNDTLPATFAENGGSAIDTRVSDLNITGGIGYSADGFNLFTPEPTGYTPSSSSQLSKQIGLLSEPDVPGFDSKADRQFETYEPAGTFREIQADLASSLPGGRSNKYYDVNMSDVYLKLDINYDLMNELLTKITSDPRWDVTNGMTDNEIIAVLSDYIFDYTHGMMLGIANQTTVQGITGHSNWDLSNEIVATLSNSTDSSLTGFTSDSLFITLGLISYILEFGFNPTTTSMVASGIYGKVPTVRRGIFDGLSVAATSSGIPVYQQFLNLDLMNLFGTTNTSDFKADLKPVISEFMDFQANVAATVNYWAPITLFTLLFFYLGIGAFTDGGWTPGYQVYRYIKGKGRKMGPLAGQRAIRVALVLFGMWWIIGFIVRTSVAV